MNAKQLKIKIEELSSKPFKDVASFLKSSTCYQYVKFRKRGVPCNENPEIFWHSELPVKYIKEFAKTAFTEELLFGYFSKSENASSDFIQSAIINIPLQLIKILKLTKSFEDENHWNTFKEFQNNSDKRFHYLYIELSFLKKLTSDWGSKSIYYQIIIENFDYEDILIHAISYYEKFKRSSRNALNNRSHIVKIDMNFNYVLNEILNVKKRKYLAENRVINEKYTTSDFAKVTEEILPPINPIEGIAQGKYLPNENISYEKKILRETFEFYFAFHRLKYQISLYLAGYAEFETIDNFEADLLTNANFSIYQRNDNKNHFDEYLFVNKLSEKQKFLSEINTKQELYDREVFLQISSATEYFRYLKLPLVYKTKYNGEIDFEKVIKLLVTFSKFLIPSGRQIIGTFKETEQGIFVEPNVSYTRKKPDDFIDYFHENYIICFHERELLYNCEMYFNWDEDETKRIIEYLTTDLGVNRNFKIDYLQRPIIKIGTQYIWLSSLLRDRRWEVIMQHRISFEKINNHIVQSTELEKGLSEEFQKMKFNSVSSHYYKTKEYEGEIDTIAFKDKKLFVIELKTTYGVEDILRNEEYASRKFTCKASEQLERNIKYINEHFEEIKEISELKIDCEQNEIILVPIIVSNIFDADDYIANKNFLKISLFELIVILNNDLYNMLNLKSGKALFGSDTEIPVPFLLQQTNLNSTEFRESNIKTDFDTLNLWTDSIVCSADDIINSIKNDKVWTFLDDLKYLNYVSKIELKQFDPNTKYIE